MTPVIHRSASSVQSAGVEWATDRLAPRIRSRMSIARAVDEHQPGDRARAGGTGYQIGTGVPVALMPDERQAVVEDGRREEPQEAPHRRPRGGASGAGRGDRLAAVRVAVGPVSPLARAIRPRSLPRPRPRDDRTAATAADDRAPADALASAHAPGHRGTIPARPARATMTITMIPMVWIRSSGTNANRSASDAPGSAGPARMKSAKKAARKTAITVPRTGRVYIVRARPVRS